ncbi:uncharacterized protein LOC134241180 [Saccostrea cucullata]|uniref:uncharacterized protein LOC134241180 n=1 Tax=Saccostrea cuccullata TaxID=36930 RepID=UPI002ED5D4F9
MLIVLVFSRYVCLLVVLITINGNTQSKGDCANDGRNDKEECCTNYYMVEGICRACPPGYFGEHCAIACPYPSFGVTCGDECKCKRSDCNHEVGCLSNGIVTDVSALQTSSSVLKYISDIEYSTSNVWNRFITTNHESASNSPLENTLSTIVIFIVGGILAFFLLIIIVNQIHGKVSRMKKERVSRDSNNQQSGGRHSEEYCVIDESQLTGSRYQHIETNNSSQIENKSDEGDITEKSPDQPLLPTRPLTNPTMLSSQVEVFLDYYGTAHGNSISSNPSSDGSYEKPVNNVSNYAKVIDTKDGEILVFLDNSSESSVNQSSDIQDFKRDLHSSEHPENAPIASHSQQNIYLDVIHK